MNHDDPLRRGVSEYNQEQASSRQRRLEYETIVDQQINQQSILRKQITDEIFETLRSQINPTIIGIHKGNIKQILSSFGGREASFDSYGIVLEQRKTMQRENYFFGLLSRNVNFECDTAFTIFVGFNDVISNSDIGIGTFFEFQSWFAYTGDPPSWRDDHDSDDTFTSRPKKFRSSSKDDFLYKLGKSRAYFFVST